MGGAWVGLCVSARAPQAALAKQCSAGEQQSGRVQVPARREDSCSGCCSEDGALGEGLLPPRPGPGRAGPGSTLDPAAFASFVPPWTTCHRQPSAANQAEELLFKP